MHRLLLLLLALIAPLGAQAQFVWPKPEYTEPEPGVYEEDPFIVKYRKEFFAVFRGDFVRFRAAFAEIQTMVEKDPTDARAMVWLGNGQTVEGGLQWVQGNRDEARKLLAESRITLDKAVALSPEDPNIYMMRAATLYVQGQYLPAEEIPRANWEKLRDDCLRFIEYIGPDRMKKVSIHLRGETYGELGIAYLRLGEYDKAVEAFEQVIAMNPGTSYEARAKREIEAIRAKNAAT